jgi:hypothetical protein
MVQVRSVGFTLPLMPEREGRFSNVFGRRLPHQGSGVWMTATKGWMDATKV